MLEMNSTENSESNSEPSEFVQKTVLIEHVIFEIKKLDKAESSKNNIISGFNQMIEHGLINPNNLEEQFSINFQKLLLDVKSYINIHNKSKSWPSYLNDIRYAVDAVVRFDISDITLSESLYIIGQREWGKNKSKYMVSNLFVDLYNKEKDTVISLATVYSWLTERNTPNTKKSSVFIEFLDNHFFLNGQLIKKIQTSCSYNRIKKTSKKVEENSEIPSLLLSEIESYISYRVDRILPDNPSYSHFEIPQKIKRRLPKTPGDYQWTRDENGYCSSIERFKSQCLSFVRFLKDINYRVYGLSHEESMNKFSFVDFFNHELIDGYSNWLIRKNIFNTGYMFYSVLVSECKNNSYTCLYLILPSIDSLNDWQEYLKELSELELKSGITSIKEAKKKYNNNDEEATGKRNVQSIMNSGKKEAKKIIQDISNGLNYLTNTYSYLNTYYMVSLRAALFFDIETVRPLRVKNMSDMEYVPGDLTEFEITELHIQRKCVLYKSAKDGFFYFYVHKNHLKNRASKKITSITQKLPSLTKKIEHYLQCRNQFLEERNIESSWLFCNFMKRENKRIGCRVSESNLCTTLKDKTKKVTSFLYRETNPELVCEINPHGMRHLIATLFLWDHPQDYGTLATLLMDDLNTVMSVYADLDHDSNNDEIADWSMQWGDVA
jgi:hypothetical protein